MEEPSFDIDVKLVISNRGNRSLVVNGFKFVKQSDLKSGYIKWFCEKRRRIKCQAKCITQGDSLELVGYDLQHSHGPDPKKYLRQAISNRCKRRALEDLHAAPVKIIREAIASNMDDEAIAELDDHDINYIRKNIRTTRIRVPAAFAGGLEGATESTSNSSKSSLEGTTKVTERTGNSSKSSLEGTTKVTKSTRNSSKSSSHT